MTLVTLMTLKTLKTLLSPLPLPHLFKQLRRQHRMLRRKMHSIHLQRRKLHGTRKLRPLYLLDFPLHDSQFYLSPPIFGINRFNASNTVT